MCLVPETLSALIHKLQSKDQKHVVVIGDWFVRHASSREIKNYSILFRCHFVGRAKENLVAFVNVLANFQLKFTKITGVLNFCLNAYQMPQSCLTNSFRWVSAIIHVFQSSQFPALFTLFSEDFRIRPYSVECTRSRSISEVKQLQAGLVLGWVTAWEYPVPYPFIYSRISRICKKYISRDNI